MIRYSASDAARKLRKRLWSATSLACAVGAVLGLADGAAKADPVPFPAMSGPLSANPNPTSFQIGDFGTIYATGAASAIGYTQDNPVPGDHSSFVDLANGQVVVQKKDGWLQFYVQAGTYSLSSLGASYVKSSSMPSLTYGVVPQAFVKIAPADNFSISIGKLPTLIGDEYTFTYENMNIERGLLWNQEPAVSRGVQANYSVGPLSLAVSLNDGFYSNHYNWLSGSATYAFNGGSDTLAAIGGGNLGTTHVSTFATPFAQNNGSLFNLIYTHVDGPWTISPYLQYTHVPASASLGIGHEASTFGGALLASYAFDEHWKLTGRGEYIDESGTAAGTPNLLYGQGSHAWSFTITPTFQYSAFFARAEFSYVGAGNVTPGFGFGPLGTKTEQTRGMFEAGILL